MHGLPKAKPGTPIPPKGHKPFPAIFVPNSSKLKPQLTAATKRKHHEQLFNPAKPYQKCVKLVQNPFKTHTPTPPTHAKSKAFRPPTVQNIATLNARVLNTLLKHGHN